MQITEENSAGAARSFIKISTLINKDNPKYIRPLDTEINDVFDPKKNKAFKYGTAKRWILGDDKGNLIGRIAAFTSTKYINKGDTYPVGCCGFFDCINDQVAANLLFDTAKQWLVENNMHAMD